MKIQIDLDPELWNRFRDVVIAKGQTLKEVVPTVFEPALRWYLHDPPLTTQPATEETKQAIIEASNKGFPLLDSPPITTDVSIVSGTLTNEQIKILKKPLNWDKLPLMNSPHSEEEISRTINPPYPPVKRCDLCDMPTERTFNHNGRKVCYTCWRDGIINEGTKPETTTQ